MDALATNSESSERTVRYVPQRGQNQQGLAPAISFADQELLLLIPQISAVPEKHLKSPIGSLSHFRDQIVGALDVAITVN